MQCWYFIHSNASSDISPGINQVSLWALNPTPVNTTNLTCHTMRKWEKGKKARCFISSTVLVIFFSSLLTSSSLFLHRHVAIPRLSPPISSIRTWSLRLNLLSGSFLQWRRGITTWVFLRIRLLCKEKWKEKVSF